MDDGGSLAAPPSERNRVSEMIYFSVLQVNRPRYTCRKETLKTRRRGCGMWVIASLAGSIGPKLSFVHRACDGGARSFILFVSS